MEQFNNSEASTSSLPAETHVVTFLVVGGGIAGVSCAESLAIACPDENIILLTESNIIKTTANLHAVARHLLSFDVEERTITSGGNNGLAPSIRIVIDELKHIDATKRQVCTLGNRTISYRFLCLCTGAKPHLIASDNERVLGIRDTDSVMQLQRRLHNARKVVLVGNGGIASELAHELHGVEVHWVVKDNHIASTFVDAGAAHFFMQPRKIAEAGQPKEEQPRAAAVKRLRFDELQLQNAQLSKQGAALGPDWHRHFELVGKLGGNSSTTATQPIVHYRTQVESIITCDNRVQVTLSTGESIECDFVVSATGVEPRHEYSCSQQFTCAPDGGIAVNAMMETNVPDVYAAGDVCTADWPYADHWFQMRLWTQARQMGAMAGRSMSAKCKGETTHQDFCFELFGHVTKLFGYQVVLLGRYNGQGLGTGYELLLRSTPGYEYIKLVLKDGVLRGALLIGETELAEMCENLILNGLDLTPFGEDILNPDVDVDDFFD